MSEIQTILGPISPEELGITLYHEHLAMKPGSEKEFKTSILDEPDKITKELLRFKKAGGGSFVEMTPLNFDRDIQENRLISQNTGVHVICCTGFHKEKFLPDWVYTKEPSEIKKILLKEISEGIDNTKIKAGVLKIGTSLERIFPIEEKIINIVSTVQKKTGIPISTHCDKGQQALEQCKLFLKNTIQPARVIIGHVDIPNDVDYLKEICQLGFNVGIDHIGRDIENHDRVKIKMIRDLIDAGFIKQIFIAGDMGKKEYLKVYGGTAGFDYIVTDFKEYLFQNGIDEKQYSQILIENPKRFFQND